VSIAVGDYVDFTRGLRVRTALVTDIPEFDKGIYIVEYDKNGETEVKAISDHSIVEHYPMGDSNV
jgi:hypothetical protein